MQGSKSEIARAIAGNLLLDILIRSVALVGRAVAATYLPDRWLTGEEELDNGNLQFNFTTDCIGGQVQWVTSGQPGDREWYPNLLATDDGWVPAPLDFPVPPMLKELLPRLELMPSNPFELEGKELRLGPLQQEAV